MNIYTVCSEVYDSCPLLVRAPDEDVAITKALDYWEGIFGKLEPCECEEDDCYCAPQAYLVKFENDVAEFRDVI